MEPKIIPVKIPKELELILSSKKYSKISRNNAIRRHSVGFCQKCDNMASKIISYDAGDGARRIERYCDKHGPN